MESQDRDAMENVWAEMGEEEEENRGEDGTKRGGGRGGEEKGV